MILYRGRVRWQVGQFYVICLVCCPIAARGAPPTCDDAQMSFRPHRELDLLVGETSKFELTVGNCTSRVLQLSVSHPDGDVIRLRPSPGEQASSNTALVELSDPDPKYGTSGAVVEIKGTAQGRVRLDFTALGENSTIIKEMKEFYLVKVVSEVTLEDNAFVYVLCTLEVVTLVLLGCRMEKHAVREVFVKPRPLLSGLMCQTLLIPSISVGLAFALPLDSSDTSTLLLVGSCSTSLLSPMFSVLQHGQLELALVLIITQTSVAFISMPLWLLVCRFLTSDPRDEISLPFYHLGGTLVAICLPLLTGALIQRYTDRPSARLEPALHTACVCLTLAVFTVDVYRMWKASSLVTPYLVIAALALPLAGCLAGVVVMVPMKRTASVSALKTVVSASALRNTLLAAVVQYSCQPRSRASVALASIACFELGSLSLMYVLYALHVLLWLAVPSYRTLHDTELVRSGDRPSIAEQILRNMIEAGEISFKKHDPGASGSGSDDGPASGDNSSLATTGSGFVENKQNTPDTTSAENASRPHSPELSAAGKRARDDSLPGHSGSSDVSADDPSQLCISYDVFKLGVPITNRRATALTAEETITEKIGKFEFVNTA